MTASLALGIDIGGTFTDLVVLDPEDGRAVIWKESTTPDDPARGALAGTRQVLAKAGVAPGRIGRVVHATTLFTNALIERKGARTGLLTTAGFADVLEIARERKYELYDLSSTCRSRWCRARCGGRRGSGWGRMAASRSRSISTARCARWRRWSRPGSRASPWSSCTPTPTRRMSRRWPKPWRGASRASRCRFPRTSRRRSANTRAPAPPSPMPMCGRWRKSTWSGWRRRCARLASPAGCS